MRCLASLSDIPLQISPFKYPPQITSFTACIMPCAQALQALPHAQVHSCFSTTDMCGGRSGMQGLGNATTPLLGHVLAVAAGNA